MIGRGGHLVVLGTFLVTMGACEPRLVTVQLTVEGRAFSPSERRAIEDIANAAARDVQTLLPALPKPLTLVVQWGKDVIPETGETATTVLPASVYFTIDPDRDVPSIIRTELRPTLFHELHHLVRAFSVPSSSLVDRVVTEGMATAFERDFGRPIPRGALRRRTRWIGRANSSNSPTRLPSTIGYTDTRMAGGGSA